MDKGYKIAIYLRLSLEDDYKKQESDSISNQRRLIYEYINSKAEFVSAEIIEKIDDGYSGTNFNRPGIIELLEMVRKREVNCIIVKDLSRFGRNYIEVGNYLEQVFPFLGVRFIGVNDDYDSNDPHSVGDIVSVFKTMYYDFYSKDLSEKVKSAKRTKALRGEYINSFAPYGYIKCKNNHNKLVIDQEAAKVVRYIFESFTTGKGKTEISKELNKNNVLTPMVYQNEVNGISLWVKNNSIGENFWIDDMINSILKDERYIGSVVYGRRSVIAVGSNLQKTNPKNSWIVAENMHDPIVTKEIFEIAQSLIKEVSVYNNTSKKHPVDSKIKCGNCGHTLLIGKGENPNFLCKTSRFTDKFGCKSTLISQKKLHHIIVESVRKQIIIATDIKKIMSLKKQKNSRKIKFKQDEIIRANKELSHIKLESRKLFEKMITDKVSKDFYKQESVVLHSRQEKLSDYIQALILELSVMQTKTSDILDRFDGMDELTEITDEMIENLVLDVLVYNEKKVEIRFKFQNEFDKLQNALKDI